MGARAVADFAKDGQHVTVKTQVRPSAHFIVTNLDRMTTS